MNDKRFHLFVLIPAMFYAVLVCCAVWRGIYVGSQLSIAPKMKMCIEPTTELRSVPIMMYKAQEADAVYERLLSERREAEKKTEQAKKRANASHVDSRASYSASYFRRMGEIYSGGWRWTWYSERVLPGSGLRIPGRHTDSNDYVRDGDGYICLAADSLSYGAVISTPFGGYGKVYDSGCGLDTIDVYVGW